MAGNLVKKVMLKIVADDGDSEAKLDKITAKADELGRKHPELKVKVDSAAASAKLAVLRKELKDTGNAAAGDSTSLKSRLMAVGAAAAAAGGFGGFSKDASMAQKAMSGFSLATGLAEAPVAGLIAGVGGLAAGLATAGIGLGAFGLVAKSNFTTASTAAGQVQTAQIAYNAAIAHGTKQAVAYRAEQKAIAVAYAQLSPAQIQLSKTINGAQNQWQSFVQSNTSGVSKILTQGIGLLPKVFALLQPMMAPVESALSGVVKMISGSMKSSGFIEFFAGVDAYAGPSITKLAVAVKNVIGGIGGVLQAFMPMSQVILGGLDKITGKFETWGQTLTSHSGFQSLVSMAKQDMPMVITVVKNLGSAIVHLGSSMTGLSTFSNSKMLLQLAVPLSQLVNWLSKANPALLRTGLYLLAAGGAAKKIKPAFDGIKDGIDAVKGGVGAFQNLRKGFSDSEAAASEATGIWGTFGGKMSAMVTAVKGWNIQQKLAAAGTKIWTGVQAAFDVVMDANPIALVVIGIVALIAIIVVCVIKFKAFRDFWVKLWHDVAHFADVAFEWVKSHFKLLAAVMLTIATGGLGLVVVAVVTHFTAIKNGAVRLVGDVTGFFRSLPGKIVSALGNLGSLLWQGGINLVMGLVHGIESVAMAPVHALSSIVSDVRSLLPFSPAKKGPLSGSGSPDLAGRKIGQMLAGGIAASSPAVAAAAARMAGAAGVRAGAGSSGAAGGGQVTLQIQGSDQSLINALVLALRKEIRIKGGNVQQVLGH
jgi:hypothetical protein